VTAKYATKDVLLNYLRSAGEPRNLTAIIKYMRRYHRISAGATRTQLWRLCQAGELERVAPDQYQVKAARDD
jgi:hypothetical protein